MGAAFLITLREGLEAALLVSIILAYLNTIGRRDRHEAVWGGVGGAAGLSLLAGLVIFLVAGGLPHAAAEAFEGVATLLAVGVLTWMIFWMRRQARHLKADLQGRVDLALSSGSSAALGLVAFVVVLREGLETALFLFSAFKAGEAHPALKLTGAVLGLGLAAGLGWLIYRGGSRLNLRTFFRMTGALLLLVAASLLVYGLHELAEAGWLRGLEGGVLLERAPGIAAVTSVLSRIVVGLRGHPNWLEFIAWAGYLVVTGFFFLRPAVAPVISAPAERTGA